MNNWMADPFDYPEKPLDRGKVLSAEDLERVGTFARYKDVDGDGIPYRTCPDGPPLWPLILRVAVGTTRSLGIPSGPRTTPTLWIVWPKSMIPLGRLCLNRSSDTPRR